MTGPAQSAVFVVPSAVNFPKWKTAPASSLSHRLLLRNMGRSTAAVRMEAPRTEVFKLIGPDGAVAPGTHVDVRIPAKGSSAVTVQFVKPDFLTDLTRCPHGNWQDFIAVTAEKKKYDVPLTAILKSDKADPATLSPPNHILFRHTSQPAAVPLNPTPAPQQPLLPKPKSDELEEWFSLATLPSEGNIQDSTDVSQQDGNPPHHNPSPEHSNDELVDALLGYPRKVSVSSLASSSRMLSPYTMSTMKVGQSPALSSTAHGEGTRITQSSPLAEGVKKPWDPSIRLGPKTRPRPPNKAKAPSANSPKVKRIESVTKSEAPAVQASPPVIDITPTASALDTAVFLMNEGEIFDSRGRRMGNVEQVEKDKSEKGDDDDDTIEIPKHRIERKKVKTLLETSARTGSDMRRRRSTGGEKRLHPQAIHTLAENFFDAQIRERNLPGRLIHREVVQMAKCPPPEPTDDGQEWDEEYREEYAPSTSSGGTTPIHDGESSPATEHRMSSETSEEECGVIEEESEYEEVLEEEELEVHEDFALDIIEALKGVLREVSCCKPHSAGRHTLVLDVVEQVKGIDGAGGGAAGSTSNADGQPENAERIITSLPTRPLRAKFDTVNTDEAVGDEGALQRDGSASDG